MVRSHAVMVWRHYLSKKSLLGGEWWWQTKFNVSPGPGLWSLVLGPFGPDLGPDLNLTWDLNLSLTIYPLYETFTLNSRSDTANCQALAPNPKPPNPKTKKPKTKGPWADTKML